MIGSRPRPTEYATEAQFLDAVSAYVKGVTASNKAYGKKIDAANEFGASHSAMRFKRNEKRTEKQDKTLHDVLQSNPVLLVMYKQGRLF